MEISEGHRFGAPSFLRQLILCLIQARDVGAMNDVDLQLWEEALAVEEADDDEDENDGEESNNEEGDAEDEEEGRDQDNRPPSAKRHKRSTSTPMDTTVPGRRHISTQHQADRPIFDSPPPLTDQNDSKLDNSTPRHVDKNGVAVPWLYQIGKRLHLLATGRSGSVTKICGEGNQLLSRRSFSKKTTIDHFTTSTDMTVRSWLH